MQVKSIAECSKGSILQYFRSSLSYHLSLRSLFCLFLIARFTQVLLYSDGLPHTAELNQDEIIHYIFSDKDVILSLKIIFTATNSVDPDELQHKGLHCLLKYPFTGIQ